VRLLAVLVPLLALAVGIAAVVEWGRSQASGDSVTVEPAPGPAGYRVCPRANLAAAGFEPRNRTLRNLGGRVQGHSTDYGTGVDAISAHVGYDALDALEDLDLERVEVGVLGRRVALLSGGALQSRAPVGVAQWEEPTFPERCQLITLIARSRDRPQVRSIAQRVIARLDSPAAASTP